MKNQLLKIMLFLLSMGVVLSCSKDDSKDNDLPGNSNFTVYKNQTGNPGADALQAQYIGGGEDYKVNFYGKFDSSNDPSSTSTITYQKKNSDTIVHFVLEPATKKLASSYITVNGEKSPIVTRFDYFTDSQSAIGVSYYNYNWSSNTSELIFSTRLDKATGIQSLVNTERGAMGTGSDWLTGIGVGVAVAETYAYYQGGATLVSILSTGAAALLASTTAVAIITGVAVGVVISVISAVLNPANASELNPQNKPYPPGTNGNNPVAPDPTSHLPIPVCINTSMTFSVSMDGAGSIMIWGVKGGSGNYSYLVNSLHQQTEVFGNNYPDGVYLIAVKDASGCVSARKVALSREISTQPQWYKGIYTLITCSSCCGAQMGQTGDVYVYIVNGRVVSYAKSILSTVGNVYQAGDASETVLMLNPSPNFGVGYVSYDVGSTVYSDPQFGLGYANNQVVCEGGPSGFERYAVSIQLDYFGAAPPAELTPLNLEIMNSFVNNMGYEGYMYYFVE